MSTIQQPQGHFLTVSVYGRNDQMSSGIKSFTKKALTHLVILWDMDRNCLRTLRCLIADIQTPNTQG